MWNRECFIAYLGAIYLPCSTNLHCSRHCLYFFLHFSFPWPVYSNPCPIKIIIKQLFSTNLCHFKFWNLSDLIYSLYTYGLTTLSPEMRTPQNFPKLLEMRRTTQSTKCQIDFPEQEILYRSQKSLFLLEILYQELWQIQQV